jgi:hypothetical protein
MAVVTMATAADNRGFVVIMSPLSSTHRAANSGVLSACVVADATGLHAPHGKIR